MTSRPWNTIEKVDQAFADHNRDEQRERRPRLTVFQFRDKCVTALKEIAPEEKAAIDRWVASRMRG